MTRRMRIEFDLLANARDSLNRSVRLLAWKELASDQARLKHAITGIARSIELLLKERLRRVNPAFVWENVDKYPSLEARTVTVETAVSRLQAICDVAISKEDREMLRAIRTTRNAIEHYEWRSTEGEAKAIVSNALSFALSFAKEELETDFSADFKDDDTWNELLNEMYGFVRAYGARLEAKLRKEGGFPACCDSCGELTAPIQGGSCSLCGHWQDV